MTAHVTRPAASGLLVFDGDCAFCTSSARFASRWVNRAGRYAIAPWQQLDLAALGLTADECLDAAQFVCPDGQVRAGHQAIAEALRQGSPPFGPLGAVLGSRALAPLARRVYEWVAENRYRLPGGTAACAVQRPATPDDTPPSGRFRGSGGAGAKPI